MWSGDDKLEGRAEIYLRWNNLVIIALVIVSPLAASLVVKSLPVRIVLWVVSLAIYMTYLRTWGACVTAIAAIVLPWYIFAVWKSAPAGLAAVPAVISLIEISYIRHRMRFIRERREEDGIPL